MLSLASSTEPAWTARALGSLDEILIDHAHCEKKAAGMAVRLLFSYPHHDFLQEPLSRLAREELAHFEEVLAALHARGMRLRPQRPAPYAGRLRERVRHGEPERLVDLLLCNALIEARSCERFGLLARAVGEPTLARFYSGLHEAEARHHRMDLDLASEVLPRERVRARLDELAGHEARVLAQPPALARLHA
jgi:tRNA-(ms[2]io[6]A)-hydroxylase